MLSLITQFSVFSGQKQNTELQNAVYTCPILSIKYFKLSSNTIMVLFKKPFYLPFTKKEFIIIHREFEFEA